MEHKLSSSTISVRTVRSRRGMKRWRGTRLLGPKKWEAKALNLVEECKMQGIQREWGELNHAEQTEVIRRALQPPHFLIDPHCELMKYWDLIISIALVFTGIVTPYEVIFMGQVLWDDWLFTTNRCVDLVFITDMIMNFFLQVEVVTSGKCGSHLLKDPWQIRRRYLFGWFSIDIISILPFDIFFMFYRESPTSLSNIKMLRCLRLIRLIKLARILRTSRLIQRWQDYFAISFATQKLVKFSFVLLVSAHWMACLWGVVGISFGYELCDTDGKLIHYAQEPRVSEVSWLTTLFSTGKESPDDPCNPWHVYMASLHWSVMTITSIGYGDIVPVRNEEYIVCTLCMLFGGVLWAYIIGSLCGLIANSDPVQANFETNTDLLNSMLRDANVPRADRHKFREYLREAKLLATMQQFREVAQRFSPKLKGQLLIHVSSKWTAKVSYLEKAPERCIMDLHEHIEMFFFSRQEPVSNSTDKLCILERGTLALAGKILAPGTAFHTDCIIRNPRWRSPQQAATLMHALVLMLDREKLFQVTRHYPEVDRAIKKAATLLAMKRAVLHCARIQRQMSDPSNSQLMDYSLVDVFRSIVEFETAPAGRVGSGTMSSDRLSFRASEGATIASPFHHGGRPSMRQQLPHPPAATPFDSAIDAMEAKLMASAAAAQARMAALTTQLESMRLLRKEAVESRHLAAEPYGTCRVCNVEGPLVTPVSL